VKKTKLLDCTLRDGSYAINFQFTARDTGLICEQLDEAGFPYIEIGHGVGLNASNAGYGTAAETDEAYLTAAANSVKNGKFGMFCIPGVATLDDVRMAADLGAGFIRVGTEVDEVAKSKEFIEVACSRGMTVMSNFMKSYAKSPKEFAEFARISHEYGSALLYIVDSAGGMMPSDIEAYMEAVRNVCDIPIGFHGHDNLGLSVANSLKAAELGAKVIDGSLQGLGRSAGNAPMEILSVVLQRAGLIDPLDSLAVMDISEKFVRPLVRRRGISSLDVVTGEAHFHSSYMSIIRKSSSQHGIDPRRLILALTKISKTDAPPELVEEAARTIRENSAEVFTARFEFDEYFGNEQK
jgi:4-hydroxy-2-oxovalerate aldolase